MLFNRVYGKKTAVFIIFMSAILVFASCSIKKKSHSNRNVNVTGDVRKQKARYLQALLLMLTRN